MKRIILTTALSTLFAQPLWAAQYTIEGDVGSLTLVAQGATRAEVVAALAERFDMEVVGGGMEDGTLDGRYIGTLGQVLKSILPANGYALAYRDGKPLRVTFTGKGAAEIAAAPTPTPEPTVQIAPEEPKEAEGSARLTLEGRMQRDALAQIAPQASSADRSSTSDQEEIKAMTDRAVADLRELAANIRKIRPN